MSDIASTEQSTEPKQGWRPLLVIAAVLGALVAGTLILWAHYGTAVFFETIAAGIAMCL